MHLSACGPKQVTCIERRAGLWPCGGVTLLLAQEWPRVAARGERPRWRSLSCWPKKVTKECLSNTTHIWAWSANSSHSFDLPLSAPKWQRLRVRSGKPCLRGPALNQRFRAPQRLAWLSRVRSLLAVLLRYQRTASENRPRVAVLGQARPRAKSREPRAERRETLMRSGALVECRTSKARLARAHSQALPFRGGVGLIEAVCEGGGPSPNVRCIEKAFFGYFLGPARK